MALLKAYVGINEPEHRRHLFELAERYARETATPADIASDVAEPS